MTQFAEQLDAAIERHPEAWKFTPIEKAAMLERADRQILEHYGCVARRKDIN